MAKILIVDDSLIARRQLKGIITDLGYEVLAELENGKQALKAYDELKPDIVTMDITMPIMDGITALKKVIESDSNAKIIMISANNQKRILIDALEIGAINYITKPFNRSEVEEVLFKAVNLERKSEENNFEEIVEEEEFVGSPFEVENKEGKFLIKINYNLSSDHFNLLKGLVRGFFAIKPLKIDFLFDFNGVTYLVFNNLNIFREEIKENGGEVEILMNKNDKKNIMSNYNNGVNIITIED